MTKTNPIVVNTEILSSIAEAFSDHPFTHGKMSKNQALNVITARIVAEKRKNWGFLKGADKPVIGRGMDPESVRAALGANKSEQAAETEGNIEFFTAIYSHEHGEDVISFWGEEEAEKWRQDIAEEYWSEAFEGEEYPEGNRGAAADRYFERMLERNFSEDFTVLKCSLNLPGQGIGAARSDQDEIKEIAREALGSLVEVAMSSLSAEDKVRVEIVLDAILDEAANDYLTNHCPDIFIEDLRGVGTRKVRGHVKEEHWMLLSARMAAATVDPSDWQSIYAGRGSADYPAPRM